MPESATLFLPFPFPGRGFLDFALPDAATLEGDGQDFVARWPTGSAQVGVLPPAEVGPHLHGLVGTLDEHGAAASSRVRAMHSQAVLRLTLEPDLEDPVGWELVMRLVSASDGLVLLPDHNLYTHTGAALLGGEGLPAPTAERVARRALVLLALASRGLFDDDAGGPQHDEADALRAEIWGWLVEHGLDTECEPSEAELLRAPLGGAPRQAVVDAVWRAEGAQVLLWALGQRDLPPLDAQEHPYQVAADAGLRRPEPAILVDPTLRPAHEIEARRLQLQGLSWRFTEHRIAGPKAFDFATFADRAPMGPFGLDGVALVDGDLGLRGAAIGQADPALVGLCASIARERHIAANWLIGVNPTYGRVDAPT